MIDPTATTAAAVCVLAVRLAAMVWVQDGTCSARSVSSFKGGVAMVR